MSTKDPAAPGIRDEERKDEEQNQNGSRDGQQKTSEDSASEGQNPVFAFILISAGIVMVEIMMANYQAIRGLLKAEGEFGIVKSFGIMWNALNPYHQWEHVQLVNAFAVTFVVGLVFVHYFIRLVRTRDLYGRSKEWCIAILLYDLLVMFAFVGFCRSSVNLAMKNVLQPDTAWSLALMLFALLLIRLGVTLARKSWQNGDERKHYYVWRYYVTCAAFYCLCFTILLLAAKQKHYVEDATAMTRHLSGLGLTASIAIVVHGVLYGEFQRRYGKAFGSSKLETGFIVVAALVLVGISLYVFFAREAILDRLLTSRARLSLSSLLLWTAVVAMPLLVWQQLSFEDKRKWFPRKRQ